MPKKNKGNSKNVYDNTRQLSRGRLTIQATADTDAIRHETLQDVDHLVVPMIVLVEGVLHPGNAPFPELALASEFGKVPAGWNGRPVVFNHPVLNDVAVSANIPEVVENEAFGQLFNTKVEDKKLKTEAWINLDRVAELREEVQDAVKRLESGEVSEVSTGLFTALEEREGEFDGVDFGGIWREVVPDHLAILPEGVIGASSVAAGSGAPRLNSERVLDPVDQADQEQESGFFEKLETLGEKVLEKLGIRDNAQSDEDTRTALTLKLRDMFPDEFVWIINVFTEDGYFIHEQGFDYKMLKRSFEIDDKGMVTISTESENVRPVTEFVPANQKKESTVMGNSAEQVTAIITNDANQFTEDDRGFLSDMPESQFLKLDAMNQPAEAEPAPEDVAETPETPDPTVNAEPAPEAPQTAAEFISKAPPEIASVLNAGLKMQQELKANQIKGILSNANNTFTEDALKAMDVSTLTSLATIAVVPDSYVGANPTVNNGAEPEEGYAPAPVSIFAKANAN